MARQPNFATIALVFGKQLRVLLLLPRDGSRRANARNLWRAAFPQCNDPESVQFDESTRGVGVGGALEWKPSGSQSDLLPRGVWRDPSNVFYSVGFEIQKSARSRK